MQGASTERRCPACGALASADAEWCGQCLQPLREPEREPEPTPAREPLAAPPATADAPGSSEPGPGAPTGAATAPTWPCPACGHANAIELDACAVCGTTFAALMRQDEARPRIDPSAAMRASLLFPGLGHRAAGRPLDGLARGVLFAVLAAMAITALVSGLDSAGTVVIFGLFAFGAVAVYVGSAVEARHIAEGGEPLISSRALLWATVLVIMLSIVLMAVITISAAR